MKLSEKIQEALREQQEINLSDPAVQRRLAAQWGYVPAGEQVAPVVKDERAAFREWFEGEQGVAVAYDGLWSFAKAAWLARAALGAPSVPDFANTKDAARYRWLRENGLANEKRESRAVLPRGGKKASMAFRYWTTPEELDMTIDAMIAAAPEAKS